MPWLRGETPAAWRDYAFWEFDFRTLGGGGIEGQVRPIARPVHADVIREARWKYVHFTSLPPLLFDLQADPDEFVNLADDPSYIGERARLSGRLASHRMLHAERTLANTKLAHAGPRQWVGPRGFVPSA